MDKKYNCLPFTYVYYFFFQIIQTIDLKAFQMTQNMIIFKGMFLGSWKNNEVYLQFVIIIIKLLELIKELVKDINYKNGPSRESRRRERHLGCFDEIFAFLKN